MEPSSVRRRAQVRLAVVLFAEVCLAASVPARAKDWSAVALPVAGPARAIGQTSAGCLSGSVALPQEGPGYRVMHLERRRYFGHPVLVESIQALGRSTERERLGQLHVGDLAQPRGGPMAYGHRSHQNGLDVDVWFSLDPRLLAKANGHRSDVPAPSLLVEGHEALNRRLWEDRHRRVLELVARLPQVDRIFVNPHIKRELCRSAGGNRLWLRKIRPWYGHDDHFHARLVCPADSPECLSQEPLPPGDGCDSSLAWWFTLPSTLPAPRPKGHRPPTVPLPQVCYSVLAR